MIFFKMFLWFFLIFYDFYNFVFLWATSSRKATVKEQTDQVVHRGGLPTDKVQIKKIYATTQAEIDHQKLTKLRFDSSSR
jgi:hypothetical protein